MRVFCKLLIFGGLCFSLNAAELAARLPEAIANDEAALLAAAQAVQPQVSESGYRYYDLTVARVATWSGEPKELIVRLFLPPEKQKNAYPLVAYMHGGGFIGGNPELNIESDRDFSVAFRALLDDGFAVASLGYRLAREAGWPAPISDTLCGLRFLRDYAGNWGLDGSRVALIGHSAGARGVALLGMVPQNAFHVQDLPWQGEAVNIAAVWLWAGSPFTYPLLSEWEEFGKPRNFSVMRLHHGEHPAWDDATRHSLRIRNNTPHLSMALPAYYLLRGASDYRGDHSDAERAVEIWQALGAEATLTIVPGGHNACGPSEAVAEFMRRHLVEQPYAIKTRKHEAAAEALLDASESVAAIEVLNSLRTSEDGHLLPAGNWLYLSDLRMFWLPEIAEWPESQKKLVAAACGRLAQDELSAAQSFVEKRQWFRAAEAARNVRCLAGSGKDAAELIAEIEAAVQRENKIFRTLYDANQFVAGGDKVAAEVLLAELDDERAVGARQRLKEDAHEVPVWADDSGVDVYGVWVDLRLNEDTAIRLRHVEPGGWELPEHLCYRNREEDPWTTRINIEHGFWMAETPVTEGQWRALTNVEGHGAEAGAMRPQGSIEYLQIVDWLEKLSARHDDLLARLPTEEEWLHAATAGGRNDTMGGIDLHAVHAQVVDPSNPTHFSVKRQLPDLSGFYTILGGIQEWTASPGNNTARFNDDKGRLRVIAYPIARGGAWSSMPQTLGFENRSQQRHGNRQPDLGFRVVIGGGPDAAEWLKGVEKR